jgi:primosomal protein N' (replication factor Y)
MTEEGRYRRVELGRRPDQPPLPPIERVDMRLQIQHKLSHGQLSEPLVNALKETLARGEQAIVFNPRRGYAPFLLCGTCGHVPKCQFCDISLTFHKHQNLLRCHYCGYTDDLTGRCAACGSVDIKQEGVGTERLEEQILELLPQARIGRMDSDTTRGKNALRNLLDRFERGETDILVGTQMVTKGLDFARVTLAAVVQTDRLLNFPDFRTQETAWQILTQLRGRVGRADKPARVLIQANATDHPIFELLETDFVLFYENEIMAREWPNYPPFSRLIRLEMRHTDQAELENKGRDLGRRLHTQFGAMMLGPEWPSVARIRNLFRLHILFKIPRKLDIRQVKETLLKQLDLFARTHTDRNFQVIIDVDPR